MFRTIHTHFTRLTLLGVCGLLAACGGSDATATVPAPAPALPGAAAGSGVASPAPGSAAPAAPAAPGMTAPVPAGAAGAPAEAAPSSPNPGLFGYFNVSLNPALEETGSQASTGMIGKLYTATVPEPMSWAPQAPQAGCTLFTPNPLFCEPRCFGGDVCGPNNMCLPFPMATTAGTVKLSGLGPEVSIEPKANNYQPPAGVTLPYPPCAAGAEVKVTAAGGGMIQPFALSVPCIEPMVLADGVSIARGQPLELRWTPGAPSMRTNIHVLIDISSHGGSRGKIECDVPDTGSLSIAAAQVDALVDLGVSGFPTVLVTRETKSLATEGGPPNVTLKMSAEYRRAIEIPGLISCSDTAQCPTGQVCQADLKCM